MPAKLILTLNGDTVSEFVLEKETVSIGRRPENDLCLENLAVSGRHAQIITILNDSFLEDLNSTNGTYVNGSLIKKHALKNGDVIGIGKYQMRYVAEEGAAQETFTKTMVIQPDATGLPQTPASEALDQSINKVAAAAEQRTTSANSASGGQTAKLQILNGTNAGKELELTKALTTIGKPGNQVAAITRRPQGYFIIHVDGGKDNKMPIVNGNGISTQAIPLQDHDVIEVASVKMEFFMA